MSEKAKTILEGLEEQGGGGAGWLRLQEENHPPNVMIRLNEIRLYLQIPSSTGGRGIVRPCSELLAVILGYGQEGALRIFESYTRETARTDDEAAGTFYALRTIAQRAQNLGIIGWNLSGVKIAEAKGSRVLIALPPEVDGRMRDAAKARGESLTGFVVEAVRDRLARIEAPKRRAGGEAAAATG